ncbi:bifunctional phosphoglucose/phosphomannose isomerase [Sphingobacteriales bacterium UPWRP_1]|nr:bifunctional phosphoglucose/phosphomannose isomerase [Sphingobacteriales bacterium TSM_CSM]PSJ73918.1 bifunctional phosphoglucose/phosphomannose isomerase [Sphingobacteriales bacterium UPWRP_1]
MEQLIADFGQQLSNALEIGKNATLTDHAAPIQNILVTGLGGSGMGADVVIDLCADQLPVPMLVNKNYQLPAFVNHHTLVIASSYSGNTEETTNALQIAIERGAKIVCITTGGVMKQIARENGLDLIQLPSGRPPRASLGFSFIQQFFILHHFGFITNDFIEQTEAAIALLNAEQDAIKTQAAAWAKTLAHQMPIIYAPDGYGSVAIRWRQQINENGKQLCWHHVIPEMNHNELVGWRTKDNNQAPVFLRASDVYERINYRIDINKTIVGQYTDSIYELTAKGNTKTERLLYLIHFGDWLSWYLAQERHMDATEVKVIDYLKGELAKMH